MSYPEPETLLNTTIEDVRITGEHPIPAWLKEPEPPIAVEEEEEQPILV